jgi:hypothetical protein
MATFSFINILYCCRDDVQNVMTYKHTWRNVEFADKNYP